MYTNLSKNEDMNKQKIDVFISYSRKDLSVVQEICRQFQEHNISYWLDKKEIHAGGNFLGDIVQAIKDCKITLFISSTNSNNSIYTAKEVAMAFNEGKYIIPYKIDASSFNRNLELVLCDLNWVEAIPFDKTKALELISDIKSLLTGERKHELSSSICQQKVLVPDVIKILNENNINNSPKAELEENIKLQKINRDGKTLFVKGDGEPQFISHWNKIGYFHEGFAKVQDNSGLWGFINTRGEIAFSCNWNSVGDFSEGTATVENEFDQWGYINKHGSLIIPCKWRAAEGFSEGIARVANIEGKWGLIDAAGEQVIPCSWKGIAPCSDGMSIVLDDSNRFGYIDKHGNVAIPCQYHQAWSFTEGMAAVKDEKGKWGAINRHGNLIIPFKWKVFNPFSEGLACVQDDNGLYGFIDKKGELIIPCSWHLADIFTEGLARVVNEKGKWGYIDKSGQLVIPCQWSLAIPFKDGTAWVNTGFTARLIDKNGFYL